MRRMIFITLVMLIAVSAVIAAEKQWYTYPLAGGGLRDTGRMMVYDNLSGTRNILGSKLKTEVLGGSGPLVKQAPANSGDYVRTVEIKDASGIIKMWINESGQMIFGTPAPLSFSSVYPANNTFGIVNGYEYVDDGMGGYVRIGGLIPYVQFNKTTIANISTLSLWLVDLGGGETPTGIAPTPQDGGYTKWGFLNFSGAHIGSYQMRVVRGSVPQTDGETTSSCGSAMTDVSGTCISSFTMQ
jgi:hypothetical protein